MTRVSTAVSAPIRTGAQLGAGAVLVEFYAAFWAADWSNRQYLAALAFATLLVTAVQHLIENRTGKAVLRDVPPTTAPLVEDAGSGELRLIAVVACGIVAGIVLWHLLREVVTAVAVG